MFKMRNVLWCLQFLGGSSSSILMLQGLACPGLQSFQQQVRQQVRRTSCNQSCCRTHRRLSGQKEGTAKTSEGIDYSGTRQNMQQWPPRMAAAHAWLWRAQGVVQGLMQVL
jgi:hypothetical protein